MLILSLRDERGCAVVPRQSMILHGQWHRTNLEPGWAYTQGCLSQEGMSTLPPGRYEIGCAWSTVAATTGASRVIGRTTDGHALPSSSTSRSCPQTRRRSGRPSRVWTRPRRAALPTMCLSRIQGTSRGWMIRARCRLWWPV